MVYNFTARDRVYDPLKKHSVPDLNHSRNISVI